MLNSLYGMLIAQTHMLLHIRTFQLHGAGQVAERAEQTKCFISRHCCRQSVPLLHYVYIETSGAFGLSALSFVKQMPQIAHF